MLTTQFSERFRQALGDDLDSRASTQFAADFVRLLVRIIPNEVNEGARQSMHAALAARTALSPDKIETLLDLAIAPENRDTVEEDELRAFGARFGEAEANALGAAVQEEVDLERFALYYGPEEGLLLLDSLFAVCAEDGRIDPSEIATLQRAASELGIDSMLVGALFRKHDPRHATGDFSYTLDKDRYLIGRSLSADIQLPDPQVAVRHVELIRTDSGWRVLDLGSGRPTLLNGTSTRTAPLVSGDVLRVGPYSLSLNADETVLSAFGLKSFSALSVRHLTRKIGDVSLLDNVNFTVFSGEVIALVGPSGAGKTTLLNAIAGIAPADTGEVLLDGAPFHTLLENDRSLVGIVPQDDVVHAELTVAESLYYSGRLRFPADIPTDAIEESVERVLKELSIDHVSQSRIGDAVKRGISGGQRKRVSLGQELLTQSTKVLFLDEPTSGLDPQTAQDIVGLVRQLADGGRIVFIVTHDLTPSVMAMVDHLIVMAPGGHLAWFGPPTAASEWFKVDSPDAIFKRLQDRSPRDWAVRYREGEAARKYVRVREHLLGLDGVKSLDSTDQTVKLSSWLQFTTLTKRYAKIKLRDRVGTAVLLAQAPILGLAMWIVFPEPDTSALFMLVLSSLWFGASGSIRELISDRAIWQRERRVGIGVVPYMASKITILGLLVTLQCSTLTAIVWVLLNMSDFQISFFALDAVSVLIGLVGSSLGLLMSASFSSSEAAVGTLPLALIPQIAFGGLIVKVKEMSLMAKAISYTMFTRFAFEAAIRTGETLSVPKFRGSGRQEYPINGVLMNLGFRNPSTQDDGLPMAVLIGVLIGMMSVMFALSTWITHRRGQR